MVICPHRGLDFGELRPVQEFVERRVLLVELQLRDGQSPATPLTRANSLLLQQESEAASDPSVAEVLPLISSILITHFLDLNIEEICAPAGTINRFLALPRPAEKPADKPGGNHGDPAPTQRSLRFLKRRDHRPHPGSAD